MDRSTIVAELKLGNEEALRAIYDQYNTLLVSFARYTIRNPLLAEDFVQDAFCSLWENREKLDHELPIQSYLYRIVHRRCVDYLRKLNSKAKYDLQAEWKLKELSLTQTPFENIIISEISAEETQTIIQKTIQSLPEQTREIFQLSRYEQLKNIEIAERKGVSVKTIEYHIGKALQEFRNALKDFL
jgi:RNA polymerase sigma-70 factor, ECF subfamily